MGCSNARTVWAASTFQHVPVDLRVRLGKPMTSPSELAMGFSFLQHPAPMADVLTPPLTGIAQARFVSVGLQLRETGDFIDDSLLRQVIDRETSWAESPAGRRNRRLPRVNPCFGGPRSHRVARGN